LLHALVLTLSQIRYEAWGALVHSVKIGVPAFLLVFGARLFDYLDVDEGATFHEAISNVSPLQRGARGAPRSEVLTREIRRSLGEAAVASELSSCEALC
jgi:hypothetical protein